MLHFLDVLAPNHFLEFNCAACNFTGSQVNKLTVLDDFYMMYCAAPFLSEI